MTTTQIDGRDVILVEGCIVHGRKIAGMFECEEDARSPDADSLAVGSIAWDSLTPHQQEIATENSDRLSL